MIDHDYHFKWFHYIHAICKSVPETVRLSISAKVPNCNRRSTCTLSDLLNLHIVIFGVDPVGA